jgi:hypothetical protein
MFYLLAEMGFCIMIKGFTLTRYEYLVKSIAEHGNSDECLLWPFGKSAGYGVLGIDGAQRRAHAVALELRTGMRLDGLCALHTCDVRACYNPLHLFPGTLEDNNKDRHAKGRSKGGHSGFGPPGERHGRAKLMETDVLDIRRLYAARVRGGVGSSKWLCHKYRVNRNTIYAIVTRKLWTHI